jgi:hypothetical protein
MRKLILPIALLSMALLLGVAVVADCVRLANDGHARVNLADAEVRKHEVRLVNELTSPARPMPELPPAINAYKQAPTPQLRHQAYDRLIADFRATSADKIDPSNPLQRKFMDDVAGAINRREIAEKQFDQEAAAYRAYLASPRGSVARMFSSQARNDVKLLAD